MSWKSQMLGDELVSKNGENKTKKIKTEHLQLGDGDILGLYFSAHWCPPCRGFTPKLVNFYDNMNAKDGKKLQIVFISSDRTEKDFNSYYGEMPWHALPFESSDLNTYLSEKCNVRGIPKLVLFDSTGKEVKMNIDARTMVTNDPEGNDFPWAC